MGKLSHSDTKQKILDAAEGLFAREGFHNTSMRGITGAAGVNLAAINYHFGSKEALLDAVFERRLVPLNEQRLGRLHSLQAGKGMLEGILRAFIEPTLLLRRNDSGADAFMVLVGRGLSEPDDTVRNCFLRRMGPVFNEFFEALCRALPQVPRTLVFWRFRMALGAMGHLLCSPSRIPLFPAGVEPAMDAEEMTSVLMGFILAGMEAL